MKKLRLYIDTSVIGGCIDEEFSKESLSLLTIANEGKVTLILSNITLDELEHAPQQVKQILETINDNSIEFAVETYESRRLRDHYIESLVLTHKQLDDAHHVALATVINADLILSWNFKHLVHYDKIRGFNSINIREGYNSIDIRSPKEIV